MAAPGRDNKSTLNKRGLPLAGLLFFMKLASTGRRFLFVPFLFVLASLLQLNVVASNVVSPGQLVRPLVLLWLVLGLLVWPAYWLTRDWYWASLLLTVLVLGFASSSDFFSSVLAVTLVIGVFALAFLYLRRVSITRMHLMYILGATGIFFSVYALVTMLTILGRVPWADYRGSIEAAEHYSLENLSPSSLKPDIYYIVVDGYARSDILQEMFHFDNFEFVGFLQEAGFIVPSASLSNYPATPLSITSTLNMDYIDALVPALNDSPHRWLMEPLIDHSRLRAVLEAQGYQIISIGTNWTITDNPTADVYLSALPLVLTDFEGFLLDKTPLGFLQPALQRVAVMPTAASHRASILHSFETLADVAPRPGPKFVMAHIISPHPPFVFDPQGNPLETGGSFTFQDADEFPGTVAEYSQRYVGQVQFVNAQLEKTIESILAQSAMPPIIILQADHGSGLHTDLGSAEKTCIHERFSPFAAYYLPGIDSRAVPDHISTVNVFRLVLNEYFEAGLPLLENRQYFYRDSQNYYDFADVTGRMNDACVVPN